MERMIWVDGDYYCVFCGEIIPKQYEDRATYYECGCVDAVTERKLMDEIVILKSKMPRPKFRLGQKLVKNNGL
jgi:hypothetical protein